MNLASLEQLVSCCSATSSILLDAYATLICCVQNTRTCTFIYVKWLKNYLSCIHAHRHCVYIHVHLYIHVHVCTMYTVFHESRPLSSPLLKVFVPVSFPSLTTTSLHGTPTSQPWASRPWVSISQTSTFAWTHWPTCCTTPRNLLLPPVLWSTYVSESCLLVSSLCVYIYMYMYMYAGFQLESGEGANSHNLNLPPGNLS